jgi:hypothetical protein
MSDENLLLESVMRDTLTVFDETFEKVRGVYLDRGASLFETLATISAEEASRPVSATCATLAAQTDHTRFYLDVMEKFLQGEGEENNDWGHIWRTVGAVTPEEWDAIQARLRESHQRVRGLLTNPLPYQHGGFGDILAILVHTAYHLGEIRQALCTLLPQG